MYRTAKETQRLHQLSKDREQMPKQHPRSKIRMSTPESLSDYDVDFDSDDAFPSDLGSDAEGEGLGEDSEGEEDDEEDDGNEDDEELDDDDQSALNNAFDEVMSSDEEEHQKRKRKRAEEEADYETQGRQRWAKEPSAEAEDSVEVGRLPIKLPTGEVQAVSGSTRIALPPSKKKAPVPESEDEEEEEEDSDDGASDDGQLAERMAGQKGKFGRMGVAEIVGTKGMKNAERLAIAKEQIAQVGAEILAGGELIDIVRIFWSLRPENETDIRGLSLLVCQRSRSPLCHL